MNRPQGLAVNDLSIQVVSLARRSEEEGMRASCSRLGIAPRSLVVRPSAIPPPPDRRRRLRPSVGRSSGFIGMPGVAPRASITSCTRATGAVRGRGGIPARSLDDDRARTRSTSIGPGTNCPAAGPGAPPMPDGLRNCPCARRASAPARALDGRRSTCSTPPDRRWPKSLQRGQVNGTPRRRRLPQA